MPMRLRDSRFLGNKPLLLLLLFLASTVEAQSPSQFGSRTPRLSTDAVLDPALRLPRERQLGVRLVGSASCFEGAAGLECFVRGPQSDLLTATFRGGTWSPWRTLGGVLRSDPSCFALWPELMTCVATGQDGRLWALEGRGIQERVYHGWISVDLGADVRANEGVDCVPVPPWRRPIIPPPREAHCFTRRTPGPFLARNSLMINIMSPPVWQPWQLEDDRPVHSRPKCFIDASEYGGLAQSVRARCLMLGAERQLLEWRGQVSRSVRPNSVWRDWGGTLTSLPSCLREPDGDIRCAARGMNGQLWHRSLDLPVGPNGWTAASGSLASDPSCVLSGGQATCLAVGSDHRLWRFDLGSGARVQIPGTSLLRGQPSCVATGGAAPRIHCLTPDANGALIHYEMAQ